MHLDLFLYFKCGMGIDNILCNLSSEGIEHVLYSLRY